MITNTHWRDLAAPPEQVGHLLESLAGPDDRLWPREHWPAMRLSPGLVVGAHGGHGPIRYRVERHDPGRSVRFSFTAPAGFDGYHEYVVERRADAGTRLRHTLVMRTRGRARISWPLVYRPLHDALIEASLDRAQRNLHRADPAPRRWSVRVRLLRTLLASRPAPVSSPPDAAPRAT